MEGRDRRGKQKDTIEWIIMMPRYEFIIIIVILISGSSEDVVRCLGKG